MKVIFALSLGSYTFLILGNYTEILYKKSFIKIYQVTTPSFNSFYYGHLT